MRSSLILAFLMLSTAAAGCIGGDGDDPWLDFEPGKGYEPTGKLVEIEMWVADLVESDIHGGLDANMWGFCARGINQAGKDAIEHREAAGKVRIVPSDPNEAPYISEEQTEQCSSPGPQIRVQQGDTVKVIFRNEHFHPHTIHWHGQFVPWESDGVPGSTQDAVVPPSAGGTGVFTYEFEAKRAGTLWYHCHVDTQFHVMQGLFGMIIVEPQDKEFELPYDKEYSLVFSELIRDQVEPAYGVTDPHAQHKHGAGCGASGFPGCQNPAIEDLDVDTFMINGVSAPNTFARNDTLLRASPGEVIRVRMLNAGPFDVVSLHIHGHDFFVTHVDGNPLHPTARYWADTVLLPVGGRIDAYVYTSEEQAGTWVIHDHAVNHVTNDGQYPGGALTKLVYDGFEVTPFPDGHEAIGGQMQRVPVEIPADYIDRETIDIGPSQEDDVLGSIVFPMEQPCAVNQLRLDGVLTVSENLATFTDVEASIKDPAGTEIWNFPLGGSEGARSYQVRVNQSLADGESGLVVADLVKGDYRVDLVAGAITLGGSFVGDVYVDYFPNMVAADAAAQQYGRPKCGEIDFTTGEVIG